MDLPTENFVFDDEDEESIPDELSDESIEAEIKQKLDRELLYSTELDPVRVLSICAKIGAQATQLNKKYILIRKVDQFIDLKVCVLGHVNHGKSSLLGVLTTGQLDNGKGSARTKICKVHHEIITGRTSSVGVYIMGFNQITPIISPDWTQITSHSNKVIGFYDLCGHLKYLRMTISGLSGSNCDYALILVESTAGIEEMTIEHILLCILFKIPFIVLITKIDLCPPDLLKKTVDQIKRLPKMLGVKRICYPINNQEDVFKCVDNYGETIIPFIKISSKTGEGIDLIQQLVNLLPVRKNWICNKEDDVRFSTMNIYKVAGIGTVLYGTLFSGIINVGDTLSLGPNTSGEYQPVVVKSIHYKRSLITSTTVVSDICVALRKVGQGRIRKGMVLLSSKKTTSTWKFKAELIVHSRATINGKYEAVIHLGNICQTAKMISILDEAGQEIKRVLRAKSKANVIMKFKFKPEHILVGSRFIIREGKTKAVGVITELLE